MRDDTKTCGCCRGSGRADLTTRERRILLFLRLDGVLTSRELDTAIRMPGGRTATCNALRILETEGLIARNGRGRATTWLAKRPKRKGAA